MLVTGLIVLGACVVVLIGGFVVAKKQIMGSDGAERDGIIAEINKLHDALEELATYKDSYVSAGQFKAITDRLNDLQRDLKKEKDSLVAIEQKLTTSQKQVETKETQQQEIKSSKAEDEAKVEELLATYQDAANESVLLEQKLASSMKNLDELLNEASLSPVQKGQIVDLQNALSAAGATLRDLIMEAQQTNERLDGLKQQHVDLEEEYTKLVEKQLGD